MTVRSGYNILDWYWIVNDTTPTTNVYSSATNTYVANNAAAFLTWLTDGQARIPAYGSGTTISALSNNGAGKVRCTVPSSANFQTGQYFNFSGSTGTPLLNGNQQITVVNVTTIDVTAISFVATDSTTLMLGATVIDTAANLAVMLNNYNIVAAIPNSSVLTPSGTVTLTNPMAKRISFAPTTAISLNLPVMNAPNSPAIGDTFELSNDGNFNISLRDAIGTILGNIERGLVFRLTLTDNSTTSGTFKITYLNNIVSLFRGRVYRFTAANNAATPNTKIDISAGWMTCAMQGVGEPFIGTKGSATLDFGLAGPAANGRDEVGAFPASTWIHVYGIARASDNNTTNMAAIASRDDILPTLPAGYVGYTYLFSVYWTSGSILPPVTVRGSFVSYTNAATTGVALSAGAAVAETAVGITTLVPAIATTYSTLVLGNAASGVVSGLTIRYTTGQGFFSITVAANSWSSGGTLIPNTQNLYYLWGGAGNAAYINVLGYFVPNGDAG